MKELRIAASAIVLHDDKVLLVRYGRREDRGYLVGPGGGVRIDEDLREALVREVKEETGLAVKTEKMLFVEDLLSCRYRMLKVWFLCSLAGGELHKTPEAQEEGITEVGWFSGKQLEDETVYPEILKTVDWQTLRDKNETEYTGLKIADF